METTAAEKLDYLRKYSKTIEFAELSSLSAEEKSTFPDYLLNAFAEQDQSEKLNKILAEWDKYNYQFQSTIAYLKEELIDVEIIRQKGEISILYSIKNLKDKTVYYEGKLPLTREQCISKIAQWENLSPTIKEIYENLHNGWCYFASQSMGLSSIENVINLADMDWGILDELDVNTLPFKLENCPGLFSNGMGDYVCVDTKSRDKKGGFIWWHTKPPKLNIEFWKVVDEWTKLGIEG